MPCATRCIILPGVLALLASVGIARAEAVTSTDPVRIQYDELRLNVPSGRPPADPDSFERHYAAALEHFARSEPLSARQAKVREQREAALRAMNGPGAGDRILGMLTGEVTRLLGNANPIAGMVFGMITGAAGRGSGDKAMQRQVEANEAEESLRDEETWRPTLRRIAIWDRWLRVDDLDDGSAVIYKPDVGEYLVLDTRMKTWVRLRSAPVSDVARLVGDDAGRCSHPIGERAMPLGTRRIAGHEADGYRSVERMANVPVAGQAMVTETTVWLARQHLPDDILALLNGFPVCPADSAFARSLTVPDDRVVLYESMVTRIEGARGTAVAPADGGLPDQLSFEQHLRPLDGRDRDALFAVPADYREVR